MSRIEITGLGKSYDGKVAALEDFNLVVEDGEFCVLVGPSGCGKSTALKILAGLEASTSGTITIDGMDVTELGPGKRDIAMVFQNYALYPHMTVAANIGFGLKMRGVPRDEIRRKVEDVGRLLELTDYLHRRPRALSGGQRQRVALGRAIVRQPKAFLMDEPLSNLDAKLRVQTRAEIVKLQRRLGVTTIYVTHDQTEALTMSDKIVVLRDGRIQQVGTADELYHAPVNLFVASFIGSPAMNYFTGELSAENGRAMTRLGGERIALDLPLDAVASAIGRSATLGIRPEHVLVGSETGPLLDVALVESLGSEKILHLRLPQEQRPAPGSEYPDSQRDETVLLARVMDDRKFAAGDQVRVALPAAKLNVFDPASGRRFG